jgi:quercetin dioxygenase-like cupin family protein
MIAVGSALLALAFLSPIATAQEVPSSAEQRLTPSEFNFSGAAKGGTGTSGVKGIQTLVLKGNPNGPGLYTILLSVPAHTKIAAHSHPDERVATVISGVWRIGYGTTFDESKLKALVAGSFYTEPADDAHFAETRDTPVIVQITGYGPSGTTYTNSTPPHTK